MCLYSQCWKDRGRSLACCPANQPCLTVESLSENKEGGWSFQRATLNIVFWQAWTSIHTCSSHTHTHKIKIGCRCFTSSLLSNSGKFLQSLFLQDTWFCSGGDPGSHAFQESTLPLSYIPSLKLYFSRSCILIIWLDSIYQTILGSCMLCSFLIGWYYKQDCVQHLLSSVFQKTGPKLDPEHRVSSLGIKETGVQVPGCYWPSSLNLAIHTITVSVSPFISPPPQFPHVDTDLTARVISSVAIRADILHAGTQTLCKYGAPSIHLCVHF